MVNRNAEMTNFAAKDFRSTRRMLFVSFYVIKEPKSCTFGSVDQYVSLYISVSNFREILVTPS